MKEKGFQRMIRKIYTLVKGLVSLMNPRKWGPFLEIYNLSKFDHGVSLSWSQGGEDLALIPFLKNVDKGCYLDIGAHHPDRFSVTRGLYQKGWTGVNVEANPNLIQEFLKRRPRDLTLCYAVGLESEYVLNVFSEPAISTASSEWKERFLSENQTIVDRITVKGISLNKLINEHFPSKGPDLLVIDVEGLDFDVIQSLDPQKLSRNQLPMVIVVETPIGVDEVMATPMYVYLVKIGYQAMCILPMSTIFKKIEL
jgi:FkbM family methyltransferase